MDDVAGVQEELNVKDSEGVSNLLVVAFVGLAADETPFKAMLNVLHDICQTRCARFAEHIPHSVEIFR